MAAAHGLEADLLRRQVATLAEELSERDRMLHTIHSMQLRLSGAREGAEDDVAMQVGAVAGWQGLLMQAGQGGAAVGHIRA
jgi:hypothetical protein